MGRQIELIDNLDKLHTTPLGEERIKRNLSLTVDDVVSWCKKQIYDHPTNISKKGKNRYIRTDKYIITINYHSYTIITAHKVKK